MQILALIGILASRQLALSNLAPPAPTPEPFACDRTAGPDVAIPKMISPSDGAKGVSPRIQAVYFYGHEDQSVEVHVQGNNGQYLVASLVASDTSGKSSKEPVVEAKFGQPLWPGTIYTIYFEPFIRCQPHYRGIAGSFTTGPDMPRN